MIAYIIKHKLRRRRPFFAYITIIVTLVSTVLSGVLAIFNIVHAISETVEVSNQESFIQAINADKDVTIKLTNSFVYDASDPLTVKNNIVFDGNGYTITVQADNLIDEVAESGSLTLNNASIRATKDDVIGTVYGKLVFHSTADSGIVSEADSIVNENYGFIQFDSGAYEADYAIIDSSEKAEVIVNDGTFSAQSYAFDDLYESKLEFHKGTVSAGNDCFYIGDNTEVTIYDGVFNSEQETIYIWSTTGESIINIHGGDFQSSKYEVIENNGGTVNIFGGTFSSDAGEAVYTTKKYGNGKIYLSGTASFSSPNDYAAFETDDDSLIQIAKGYHADPVDFLTSGASSVEILPLIITVTFMSEGQTVDTITGKPDSISFPAAPTNSNGYEFLYWGDENQRPVESLNSYYRDVVLTAIFSDQKRTVTFNDKGEISTTEVIIGSSFSSIPNIDRRDSGDGFVGWFLDGARVGSSSSEKLYEDITLVAVYGGYVFTYDELTTAISKCESYIIIAADIEITEKVVINCDTHISSTNNSSLIRPATYLDALIEISGVNVVMEGLTIDGAKIEAHGAAVYVDYSSTLELKNTIIQNNINKYGGYLYWRSRYGGGIYNRRATIRAYNGTKIINNEAIEGGGIYDDYGATHLYGDATIKNNKAQVGGGHYGFVSELYMYDNSTVCFNEAYGEESGYADGGGGGVLLEDDAYMYMFDNSSVFSNKSKSDGGGVVVGGSSYLEMHDKSTIYSNAADGDGGGVYAGRGETIMQDDSVIRDNTAKGKGGGIFSDNISSNAFKSGMLYDNTSETAGDDIYKERTWEELFATQPARLYGDGNSLGLGTVMIEPIADYHEAPLNAISIPWYGWFIDGNQIITKVPSSWNPNYLIYQYSLVDGTRYTTFEEGVIVSRENDNLEFLLNDDTVTGGGKAIWYGLVLAYDANYTNDSGEAEYQYDEQGYPVGANATVKDGLFERKGYKFIGWNTSADGTGTQYASSDEIEMSSSQVLYAQWEKQSVIEDIIDDILNPTTGDGIIRLLAVFVASISILASTLYYLQKR